MEYYLGIDIGTTALKGVAFSSSGDVLKEYSVAYPLLHPRPEESVIDPELIFKALLTVVENILHAFPADLPVLVSFSAAMHSLMAVNGQGAPLSLLLTWADNRAAAEAGELHRSGEAGRIYSLTGVPVHPMSPFCKLLYWKNNPPEWYQDAARFIGIKEFLFFRLFGFYTVDISIASATGLLSLDSKSWDSGLLTLAGIRAAQLSDVVPMTAKYDNNLLFPGLATVPFVIGGSDGAMANAGTTGNDDQSLVVSIGTSSAARRTVKEKFTDPQMRSFCYALSDHSYLLGGAGNNGAVVIQWLREQLLESPLSFAELLAKGAAVAPGADRLFFLPYLLGERAPLWNPAAKGVLFGLTAEHQQAHLVRAAMEAVIFCVYAMSRPVVENVVPEKIFVTGGFARNRFWVQMLADLFDLPVELAATVENAAWGAVRTGAEAIGKALPPTAAGGEMIRPVETNAGLYAQLYRKFEVLNEIVAPAFTW